VSARYRESVATNRLHSEPNLTEYEEEKRRTNALLFRFFSKLLAHRRGTLWSRWRQSGTREVSSTFASPPVKSSAEAKKQTTAPRERKTKPNIELTWMRRANCLP